MPSTRNAGSALAILKRQFEAPASEYYRLNHLLVEAPRDERKKLLGPFPIEECRSWEEAISTQGHAEELTFRAIDSHDHSLKIGNIMGIHVYRYSGIYISGHDCPVEIRRHYFAGRDHFKRLAEQAYGLLIKLPAEIINVYPADWKIHKEHFRPFRVRRPELASDPKKPGEGFSLCTYDALLPPGGSASERWASYLHWLGWSSDVPGLKAERRTWIGMGNFPWVATIEEHSRTIGLFPPLSQYKFEDMRHYYSVIENLFLSSALAIDDIESRLSQLPASEQATTDPVGEARNNLTSMDANDVEKTRSITTNPEPKAVVDSNSPSTIRDKVFISYSHKDKRFMTDLLAHLSPLKRSGKVTEWSDKQIAPGSQWFEEIQGALATTKVAVLLVTKDFLDSDFIHEHELGPLLKEAAAGGVRVLWILVRDCMYQETPLKHLQALVSPPRKPFANMKTERDTAWREACEAIGKAMTQS